MFRESNMFLILVLLGLNNKNVFKHNKMFHSLRRKRWVYVSALSPRIKVFVTQVPPLGRAHRAGHPGNSIISCFLPQALS